MFNISKRKVDFQEYTLIFRNAKIAWKTDEY